MFDQKMISNAKMGKLMIVKMVCFLIKFLQVRGQEHDLKGRWDLLLQNSGVSAMHMILLHTNKVLVFDQTEAGPSNITFNNQLCSNKSNPIPSECWAHSVEYDIATNKVRPLRVLTDPWCSSGAFSSKGTLVQTGGWNNGEMIVRYYKPCYDGSCDWFETPPVLASRRWYSSASILPDNRIIIVGGRRSFNYEFIPKVTPDEGAFNLPFLLQTHDPTEENNLYPFLHLSSDGHLFIFANSDSILLDYKTNRVVRSFPTMPAGGAHNYPSTGSSVILPLNAGDNFSRVEVMVCGGAPAGSYTMANNDEAFVPALQTCGRMDITSAEPFWQMETMPGPRVMGDMLILPTGEVLIINGAENGTAGYQNARLPVLRPVLYRPAEAPGVRFTILAGSEIPRVYHSTATVLADGRVLVGGSNSNHRYNFSDAVYSKTELRLEAYSPYYLDPKYDSERPRVTSIRPWYGIKYGSEFAVNFCVEERVSEDVRFHVYAPPFTTHSVSMNQRMLSLASADIVKNNDGYSVNLSAPTSPVAAPSGYYLLSVVNGGIPSKAQWIRFA